MSDSTEDTAQVTKLITEPGPGAEQAGRTNPIPVPANVDPNTTNTESSERKYEKDDRVTHMTISK